MSQSHPYIIQCSVCPAEPHVDIDSGRQSDRLINERHASIEIIARKNLESLRYSVVPAHMLAPQNHDILIRGHHDTCLQQMIQRAQHPIFITNIARKKEFHDLHIAALENLCAEHGITEKFEDRPFRRGFKEDWLRKQLNITDSSDPNYYEAVRKTCMASPQKELFLQLVNEQLEHMCGVISSSTAHCDDAVHTRRMGEMRAMFHLNPDTGIITLDRGAFETLARTITQENSKGYEKRVKEIRDKMERNAMRLDRFVSGGGESIRQLKGALRRHGARFGDDPFALPVSLQEAIESLNHALAGLDAPPLVQRLINIALADDNLTIAISSNQHHVENVAGHSLDEHMNGYVLGQSGERVLHLPRNPNRWTVAEELVHHALRRIYNNDCNPFKRNGDERQKLYISAVREDFQRNGIAQAKKDFHLTLYKATQLPCEIIAKVLAMQASGHWDAIKDRYPVIEQHIQHIVTRDVDTFEQQGYVEALGKHTADSVARSATIYSGTHMRGASSHPH